MALRDRIVELRRVPAAELLKNPKNWRTHPEAQQAAMRGALAEIGYADALLARELPDGTLVLIDGHLRVDVTPDAVVPVLVLDVTEAEADKLLLSLDPLAAMATADADQLEALMRTVQTGDEGLAAMFTELAAEHGIVPEAEAQAQPPAAQQSFAVIVECEDELEQQELYQRSTDEGLECRTVTT